MAFALRRQLSDSSRKRNGGVNIRRKNRRYLAAGLTVFSLLFGGLQVWAAEEPDAGWETKIQKEEKSNMEILIASEQPYTYLSQMKERIQFVGALSLGELYQLQEILPYLIIKEHIGKERAAWDTKMYLKRKPGGQSAAIWRVFADTGVFFSGSMPGRNPKQQSRRQRRAC